MSEEPNPEERIVEALLGMAPDQRGAALEQACGKDPQLRELVQALLRAHEQIGAVLRQPPSPASVRTAAGEPAFGEKPGNSIGRYRLLQQIGEGGCGVVFMAEQQEPVKRKVALKVIKLGMDTKQVVARFEAERQALALMDHPNIAKVLDGGVTEAGRPFFVMELVEGTPITRYCDDHRLGTSSRLELFIQVCQAIQHAHQKGVIHRDIKPSNILVADHDGTPVPKVIDFGIAKATAGQTLTDKTLFTAFEQFMGTPAYMSPEQAKLSGSDIDTRSDIYSLGVLLYELLTGKTPFDAKRLIQAGLDEIRRIILEEDPPRPSTRLSTLDAAEQATVAGQRQSDAPRLVGLVRGDLDWIVMKALEKDRSRRYETANGFGMELKRFLSNEPVLARPPTKSYRLQKLVRRHRVAFVATLSVLLALLMGFGLSTWSWVQERNARRQARTEASKTEQVAQFLKNMLEGVGPSVAKGRDTAMLRDILEKTAERVDRELTNQPDVEADLLTTVGEVYRALIALPQAEAMHRKALSLRLRLWGELNKDVATSMDKLATILLEESKLAEAEPLFLKALRIRRSVLGPEHVDLATSISNLGALLQLQGKYPEAEALYRQALKMRLKLLGSDDLDTAESLVCVASILWAEHKDLPQAEAMNLQALAIRKKRLGELSVEVGNSLNNLATVYQDERKIEEAKAAFRDSIDLWKRLLGDGSPREAQGLHNLGLLICFQGKPEEAEDMVRRALEIRRRVLGEHHEEFAQSLNGLAVVLQREGKLEEAEDLQRKNLALIIELHSEKHPFVVTSMNNLAWVLRSRQNLPEAEDLLRKAIRLHREVIGATNVDLAQMSLNLGAICADQDKLAEAEQAQREAVDFYAAACGADDLNVAGSSIMLAHVLCEERKYEQAEAAAQNGLELFKKKQVERWSRHNAEAVLGRSLLGLTNYERAEASLISGCSGMERCKDTAPPGNEKYLKEALRALLQIYQTNGRPDQAVPWEKKLAALENTLPKSEGSPGAKQ